MSLARTARVLHLFANYKWTGPADPAIRTAARLRERGLDVVFAQAGFVHRGGEHWMAEQFERWRMPVVTGLQLRKHFHVRSLLSDVARLRAMLVRDRIDLVHCHLPADHLLATLACRKVAKAPVVVRSLYDPEPPPRGLRERFSFARTHGVVAPTASVAKGVVERFRLEAQRVLFQEPVTEPREVDGPDLRVEWGLDERHELIGITARVQPHRRFELLWAVCKRVTAARPNARFVLLGRGNEKDTEDLVLRPVRELGLQDVVLLPGYQKAERYDAALRSLDAFLFLVPGSDGTCRAVRDAMAYGVPVVSTQRGILAEMFAPGPDPRGGVAVEETEQGLANALLHWLGDERARAAASRAALHRARTDMDPVLAAMRLEALYEQLLREREARR